MSKLKEAHAFLSAAYRVLDDLGMVTTRMLQDSRGVQLTHVDAYDGAGFSATIAAADAKLTIYHTGKVAITGKVASADWLCEPLARNGLLIDWTPGARGGVRWTVPPTTPEPRRTDAAPDHVHLTHVCSKLHEVHKSGECPTDPGYRADLLRLRNAVEKWRPPTAPWAGPYDAAVYALCCAVLAEAERSR